MLVDPEPEEDVRGTSWTRERDFPSHVTSPPPLYGHRHHSYHKSSLPIIPSNIPIRQRLIATTLPDNPILNPTLPITNPPIPNLHHHNPHILIHNIAPPSSITRTPIRRTRTKDIPTTQRSLLPPPSTTRTFRPFVKSIIRQMLLFTPSFFIRAWIQDMRFAIDGSGDTAHGRGVHLH